MFALQLIKEYGNAMRGNRVSTNHLRAFQRAGWLEYHTDGEEGSYLSFEAPLDSRVPVYRDNYRAVAAVIELAPDPSRSVVHFGFMSPGGFTYHWYADIADLEGCDLRGCLDIAVATDKGELGAVLVRRPEIASQLRLGLDQAQRCFAGLILGEWSLQKDIEGELARMLAAGRDAPGYAGVREDGRTDFIYDDPITLRRFQLTNRPDGRFELAEMLPSDPKALDEMLQNPERFVDMVGRGPGAGERIHRSPADFTPSRKDRSLGGVDEVAAHIAMALGANHVLGQERMIDFAENTFAL